MFKLNEYLNGFYESLEKELKELQPLIDSIDLLEYANPKEVISRYEYLLFLKAYLIEMNPGNVIDLFKCCWAVCNYWIIKELFYESSKRLDRNASKHL